MTKARWPSQPMVDSSFLEVDGPSTRSGCRPGDELVLGEGDQMMSEVEHPTKDHLHLGKACLSLELVSCIHAFTGDGFVGMIWSSGCVDGEECCRLSTGNVVGTRNGDCEAKDVVNVTSYVPRGSTGISTINSAPAAKGMSGSRSSFSGTRCWFGAKRSLGPQSS